MAMLQWLGSTRQPIPCARVNVQRIRRNPPTEEREIAAANVGKALADIKAVQAIVDQMVVYAPIAAQVYERNVEIGEYVTPGVPLVTLIDLGDIWIHFDLREDLVKNLKIGDRYVVRIPALGDRRITIEVKLIATRENTQAGARRAPLVTSTCAPSPSAPTRSKKYRSCGLA
jgi:multidrug resistance efflux pump